jgi:regulatory protein
LRQKLLAKGYPETIVDQVVADLAQEGLQSNARFAEVFIRSRAEKGYGMNRIRQELRQRGLEGGDEADLPDLNEWDWDSLIGKVYAKKFGHTLPDSLPERAARENFLVRRGFGRDQIRRLFKRLRQGDDD